MWRVSRSSLAMGLFGFGILAANLISAHVHPFRTFYNELAIVWGLLLGILFRFSPSEIVVQPRMIFGLLALLAMMGMQSVMQQVFTHQVMFPAMYVFLAMLAVFFGAGFGGLDHQAKSFCHVIAYAHLLAALLSVGMETVQVMGWDWRPFVMYVPTKGVSGVRPFANIAQPNQLALLLCFGLASLWWIRQHASKYGALALFCAALLVWGLALTQSRIAWLILPLFLVMAGSGVLGARREPIFPLLLLLCLYAVLVLNLPMISEWIGFSSGSVIERIGGRSERTVLAQQALAMITSHPWLGVGWFGFGPAQVDIAHQFSPTIYAEHSHNLILNFAAELGLPFTLFFFGSLLWWLWKIVALRAMREKPEVGFFLMFLVAIGVHSMVEFPLWYAFVLLPLMVLAGLIHRLRWPSEQANMSALTLKGMTLLGLLVSGFVVFDYHRVVDGFTEFRQAKDFQSMDATKIARPKFTLMPDYYSYFSVMRIIPVAGMHEAEIEFLERTSRRFGYVHVLSKLAEVYALNGHQEKAKQMMLTLSRIHPFYYPEYYDYWQRLALQDVRYAEVFQSMPSKESIN